MQIDTIPQTSPRRIKIQNMESLIKNGLSTETQRGRGIIIETIEEILNEITPKNFMKRKIVFEGSTDKLKVGQRETDLSQVGRIVVVGGGKGSGYMAEQLEETLGDKIYDGCVNILAGTKAMFKTRKIRLNEASHPLSDERGVKGVEKMFDLVRHVSEKDLVICLISGGGSALLPFPRPPLTLEEKEETVQLLMKSGADIYELNAVRKHLSQVKGGQLARECQPARVISLILSDVVGDDLSTIASGPTAPDDTTFELAKKVLKKRGVWEEIPENARKVIENGIDGRIPENPKQGDAIFRNVWNYIIGGNRDACKYALRGLQARGIRATRHLTSTLVGESREAALAIASIIENIKEFDEPFSKPCGIVAGGETTVSVKGKGRGGRNQEFVLSAARKLREEMDGVVIASFGTDGVDGNSEAAGAIADGSTTSRGKQLGVDVDDFLENNDSNSYFERLADSIVTGPTGSNVNDVFIAVIL
jgi:glycerate 2-kinase